ncbi:serine protease HtrA [Caldisalinibacter kiritimatiensis]|uniref:Serine protease, DegP/HtrA n=1 Tax=Caldisalinibacter kiritimatiensis TaxID=1304284 RepID=R1CNA3_9FIRM|nr:trypsin-like peptidase domain-containing protein [Caldisalinibacter kiritimatiensis]EOD00191.1 Serine protease, DegP/HtrA [Caldisalinibacter kiritimatiensis]
MGNEHERNENLRNEDVFNYNIEENVDDKVQQNHYDKGNIDVNYNDTNTGSTSYYVQMPNNRREIRRKRGFFSYFIVALIAALIGGIVSGYIFPIYLYGKVIPVPDIYKNNVVRENQINITPKDDINLVTAVAKKATKSVVGITTVTTENYFFWGPREVQGVGSGVIVNSDGYILTNSHVVGDGRAEKITVQFENGEQKRGTVLWNDPALDLAIVKVDAKNLPAAELGNSDILNVGELVVAIGNPLSLDLQRTVTSGIISGLNRTIRVDENNVIEDLIQTDASINPGNSGGPLLNAKGQVIGINTAKITSAEGLGFALPINLAKPIIEQVIQQGQVKHVYMGIVGVEVETYEKRLGIDLRADEGVIIIEIAPNSPALYAGLNAGDVIIELDGKKVESMNALRKLLYKYNPGDKAIVKILRNGQQKELEIIFKERPDNY